MSTNNQKTVPQRRERPQPQYIARAKVQNGWVSIGAAWPLRSGEEGFSIKLTTTPLNWDGRFILLPPIGNEEVVEEPAEEPVHEPEAETGSGRRKRAGAETLV